MWIHWIQQFVETDELTHTRVGGQVWLEGRLEGMEGGSEERRKACACIKYGNCCHDRAAEAQRRSDNSWKAAQHRRWQKRSVSIRWTSLLLYVLKYIHLKLICMEFQNVYSFRCLLTLKIQNVMQLWVTKTTSFFSLACLGS